MIRKKVLFKTTIIALCLLILPIILSGCGSEETDDPTADITSYKQLNDPQYRIGAVNGTIHGPIVEEKMPKAQLYYFNTMNVSKTVEEVFRITGFSDFLSYELVEEEPEGTYYRRMTASDIPAVKALIERALQDERVQFIHEDFENDAWLESYDMDCFTSIVDHYHAYLMFEDRSDTLVASGYIKLSDDGKCSFVGMLFSDPAFRHLSQRRVRADAGR